MSIPQRKSKLDDAAAQVSRRANTPRDTTVSGGSLVPTGSTLLDLALSDSSDGGFGTGKMANIIGDSSAGKTFLCLSCLAEMANLSEFDDYRFIFDDVEAANEFDMEYLFGKQAASRIEPPGWESVDGDRMPVYSGTVEEFHANVQEAIDEGKSFVYVLDSMDALTSEDEVEKTAKHLDAVRKGTKTTGSYGMGKAKGNSAILRQIIRELKKGRSLVLIISQTRDNIDPMSFEKKTRSGGRALKFYATHEIWMAVVKKLKSKERIIGVQVRVRVKKNKLTGKERQVDFSIYYDYGIDDIGSCIDYLIQEKFFQTDKQSILIEEWGFKGSPKSLIKFIEDNSKEAEFKKMVGDYWRGVEESLKLGRKRKYE